MFVIIGNGDTYVVMYGMYGLLNIVALADQIKIIENTICLLNKWVLYLLTNTKDIHSLISPSLFAWRLHLEL